MKIWLIILVILLTSKISFTQTEISIPTTSMIIENYFVDSIKVYSFKNDTLKKTYQYDEKGRRIFDQSEIWDNEKWEGKERGTWTFDNEGDTTFYSYDIYLSTEWKEKYRITWTYDSMDKLINRTQEVMYDGNWCEDIRENWTYDEYGKELTYLKEKNYSYKWTEWLRYARNLHKYDVNEKLIFRSMETWKWENGDTDLGPSEWEVISDSFDIKGNHLYNIKKHWNDYNSVDTCHNKFWTYYDNNVISSFTDEKISYGRYKYIYNYDTLGNKISLLYDNDDLIRKWFWTYNSSGDTISMQQEIWDGAVCKSKARTFWTYDSTSKMMNEIKEIWYNDEWVNTEKSFFYYNQNDSLINKTTEQLKNDIWELVKTYNWFYDSIGNDTLFTIETMKDSLVVTYRKSKKYETKTNGTFLIQLLIEEWSNKNNLLNPKVMENWIYNGDGNILTYEKQNYKINFGWQNGNVTNYSYDDNHFIIQHKYQTWEVKQVPDKIWTTVFSYNYFYDPIGNLLMISSDDGGTNWIEKKLEFKDKVGFSYSFDCYKMEIFYTKVTDVEDELTIPENDIFIYPNPVSDYCNLKLTADGLQIVTIQIYNLLGVQLYSIEAQINEGENIIPLNTSILSSGLYSIVISYPNKVKRGMFIKD
ncbi:MAG: T9SS type A sorting domain-containing protein [bacterium]